MGVLVMLAERAGHVIPREELLSRLWPNVVVSDDALTRCLYELRRQLAQAGGSDDYRAMVETLPKRGYRLNGTAVSLPAGTRYGIQPQAASGPGWRIVVAALAVVGMGVALAAYTGSRQRADLDRGHSVHDMSPKPGTRATSRTASPRKSSNRLWQSKEPARDRSHVVILDARRGPRRAEIARRLGVTHVLEGSVRKSGDETAGDGPAHLRPGRLPRLVEHVRERVSATCSAIQDEIAAGVATALDVALVPRSAGASSPPAPEAHDSFLRGEFFYHRRAPGDIDRAILAYETAVTSEPTYARAWAALAGAYSYKAWQSDPPQPGLLEKQRVAAERAVELDPKLAVAHLRLAQYYGESGQVGKGQHHAIAEQLDPGHPLVLSWAANERPANRVTSRARSPNWSKRSRASPCCRSTATTSASCWRRTGSSTGRCPSSGR